jgi:uncharacterized OB-fold protein
MTETQLPNPAPYISPEVKEFWDATAEGRLTMPKCDDCSLYVWYPRPFCPACGSTNVTWTDVSGKGTVYTFTIVHRSGVPGFRDSLPYVIAYVELEERPRVMTNIVGIEPDQITVGLPVSVVFSDTEKGNALFRFQPA